MEDYSFKTRKIVFVALFAALIAVFGIVAVPVPGTPVPIVLQNMLVILTSLVLGKKLGVLSVALLLFTGLIGLPVFSGGGGGPQKAGPYRYLPELLPAHNTEAAGLLRTV